MGFGANQLEGLTIEQLKERLLVAETLMKKFDKEKTIDGRLDLLLIAQNFKLDGLMNAAVEYFAGEYFHDFALKIITFLNL